MKKSIFIHCTLLLLFLLYAYSNACSQTKGIASINEKDLRYNLAFLGSREFRGRETSSAELEIASLYLGNWAEFTGLKPLMKNNSFYQEVPMIVTSVFQPNTRIRVSKDQEDRFFYFGKAFSGNFLTSGSYWGDVVFARLGISEPETGWDPSSLRSSGFEP
jgi:hypothetical protein